MLTPPLQTLRGSITTNGNDHSAQRGRRADRGPTPAPFTQITSGEPSLAIDTSGRLWMSAAP